MDGYACLQAEAGRETEFQSDVTSYVLSVIVVSHCYYQQMRRVSAAS